VDRHQARLAELRAADGEHAGREIDIGHVEIAHFAEPEAGDRQ
jgi:hypothetical protein